MLDITYESLKVNKKCKLWKYSNEILSQNCFKNDEVRVTVAVLID